MARRVTGRHVFRTIHLLVLAGHGPAPGHRRRAARRPGRARAVTVAGADGALLINAWREGLTFRLPGHGPWSVELDTADPRSRRVVADTVELVGRSLALLTR
jgi:hypothetical protein